jgi:hypothetical protein
MPNFATGDAELARPILPERLIDGIATPPIF